MGATRWASMTTRSHLVARCAWLVVLLCLAGCGRKSQGPGKPVEGKVTYHDQPVAGATVTFSSTNASASGITDEQGHFKLRTAIGENVPPGDYRVLVSKTEDAPRTGVEATSDADYKPPDPNEPPPPAPKDLLPTKYKALESTDLTATVSDKAPNEFTFPLKD